MTAYLLTELPDVVLEKILLYLSYEEISKLRLVCRRFNNICQKILNKGFTAVELYHSQCLKEIRKQLPRRESERKLHPMSRHSEILTCVETRISLLGMTYRRFIDLDMCCFIPGKVIDEVYRVLRTVKHSKLGLPRAYDLLQELRDISSMAMEHFDEKIAPRIKAKCKCPEQHYLLSNDSSLKMLDTCPSRCGSQGMYGLLDLKQELLDFVCMARICVKRVKYINLSLNKQIILLKRKMIRQDRLFLKQENKIKEQERRTQETEKKLLEQQQILIDLQKELNQYKDASYNLSDNRQGNVRSKFLLDTKYNVNCTNGNFVRKRKKKIIEMGSPNSSSKMRKLLDD